ncbi:MAG: hypothetical protein V4723_09655 [Pseudomonadota bacterium]
MAALIALFKFLLPVAAAALLAYGAVLLASGRPSPARNWMLASNGRIVLVGVVAVFLVWILLLTYQQITSM